MFFWKFGPKTSLEVHRLQHQNLVSLRTTIRPMGQSLALLQKTLYRERKRRGRGRRNGWSWYGVKPRYWLISANHDEWAGQFICDWPPATCRALKKSEHLNWHCKFCASKLVKEIDTLCVHNCDIKFTQNIAFLSRSPFVCFLDHSVGAPEKKHGSPFDAALN